MSNHIPPSEDVSQAVPHIDGQPYLPQNTSLSSQIDDYIVHPKTCSTHLSELRKTDSFPSGQFDAQSTSRVGVPSGAHLIVATHNEHKLGEIRSILLPQLKTFTGNDRCVECNEEAIISAKGLNVAEPVEDGITFTDNAFIKARALCHATGLPAVADDSGLAVDILGGAPGIFSARWCGHHGDDQANLQLLLDQLHDVHDPHRGASFICAAVVVCPDGTEKSVLAQMSGRLINEPRGSNGFGYDPIFIADGQTRTNAELSAKEKHALSHRGKAFRILAPFVAAALGYQVTTIIADKK